MYSIKQTKHYTFVRFQEKKPTDKGVLKAQETLKLMRYYGVKTLHEKRTKSSATRTRSMIRDIIEHNITTQSVFITLTYAENMQDYKQALKDYKVFSVLMNRYYQDFKYICIKELQERGAIHFHLIWFNAQDISQERLSKIWKNGFVHIKEITDISNLGRISSYMSKYLTDQTKKQILKGFRKFSKSNNLLQSYTAKITEDEYYDIIQKNQTYCITKTDNSRGFQEKHVLNKIEVDILPF